MKSNSCRRYDYLGFEVHPRAVFFSESRCSSTQPMNLNLCLILQTVENAIKKSMRADPKYPEP